MKKNKELVIISNEKISNNNKKIFFCKNIDMKSIPEGLNNQYKVKILACKRNFINTKTSYQIKLTNIKIASNIFTYLFYVLKTFKKKKY